MKRSRIINNDSKFQINMYFFEIVSICLGLKLALSFFNVTEFTNIDEVLLLLSIGFDYDLSGKDRFIKLTIKKENKDEASEL